MGKRKKEIEYIKGEFIAHRDGYGFVAHENKMEDEPDIFIAPDDTHGAMNGDTVLVDLLPKWLWRRTRPEGIVTKIITRKTTEVTGTFRTMRRMNLVKPADPKNGMVIEIPDGETSGARSGDKVVVRILTYPERGKRATGHVSAIVARKNEKSADLKELIRSKGFMFTFPSSAQAQAAAVAKKGVEDADLKGRVDLRDKRIFTIDGAHSKDFDDAVSIERNADGNYVLGVHIADVSHYVTEDSPLDREALKRGNSVYVIDQVVPMLPKELSNDICSLNEGVDRLCLSVSMTVNERGELLAHEIFESVIHSCHRLVYDDVSDILENHDPDLIEKYDDIHEDLVQMHALYEILTRTREERGSIDFESEEAEFSLNDRGEACDIGIAERRTANRLIEEFMLLANETVATEYFWLDLPFIYRVHERPEPERMRELKKFLDSLSIHMKADPANVHPKVLSDILKNVEGSSCEGIVSDVMLRSMQKAYYSTECGGHYGLALTYYTHFTSPIRRYSDLFIHRVIKEQMKNGIHGERIQELSSRAVLAAENASKMERLAVEAERDGEKMKKAEYMTQHIHEIYDAVVSGVTASGFFIRLDNTVEGLVRLDSLTDDYYFSDLERYRVIGERTRKIYALGDKVQAECIGASIHDHTVDFAIHGKKKNSKGKRRRPPAGKRRKR